MICQIIRKLINMSNAEIITSIIVLITCIIGLIYIIKKETTKEPEVFNILTYDEWFSEFRLCMVIETNVNYVVSNITETNKLEFKLFYHQGYTPEQAADVYCKNNNLCG
jgi:Ca2+/Na+ antiporter